MDSKICSSCGSKIRSRRKFKCDSCYSKEWQSKQPKKVKITYINCLICDKSREKSGRSKKYCNSCAVKEHKKKYPESAERRRIQSRTYSRIKSGIDPNLPLLRAKSGTGYINSDGYRIIQRKNHPNCTNESGAIGEHTFIMSEYLKRPLIKGEFVHHKNGIRSDNRIDNLELWDRSHPSGQRVDDKIQFYREFLTRHGYVVFHKTEIEHEKNR